MLQRAITILYPLLSTDIPVRGLYTGDSFQALIAGALGERGGFSTTPIASEALQGLSDAVQYSRGPSLSCTRCRQQHPCSLVMIYVGGILAITRRLSSQGLLAGEEEASV